MSPKSPLFPLIVWIARFTRTAVDGFSPLSNTYATSAPVSFTNSASPSRSLATAANRLSCSRCSTSVCSASTVAVTSDTTMRHFERSPLALRIGS